MADILEQLAAYAEKRVAAAKEQISMEQMKQAAYSLKSQDGFPFYQALAQEGMSFITECKKASVSKGVIAADFPYLEIARSYEEAGAACISVLTEPKWFLGSLEYLREIAADVRIPVLRKDFIVDEYMIYEAKTAGASAVLLICSLLDEKTLQRYLEITHELGMSALVEAHDEKEVTQAVGSGAGIIGVNNRNLRDFSVDLNNSIRLRRLVPDDILFVAESGIRSRHDIEVLEKGGISGVLIGETLMRAENKKEMLDELKGKRRTV